MFNMQNAMRLMQQLQNPQQFLMNMGIPREHLSDPQTTMKYLMDSGRVNQQQIDQMNNFCNQFNKR